MDTTTNSFRTTYLTALAALICLAGPSGAANVQLFNDSKAECVIVIGKDASWLEKHAAGEFVKYFAKMTGPAAKRMQRIDTPIMSIEAGRSNS
ncbi:MAG: hypothetical protein QGH94_18185 [Phycisphaerae bacterium]|nr:hypothetical protein [Phycisphaerae bacterium]